MEQRHFKYDRIKTKLFVAIYSLRQLMKYLLVYWYSITNKTEANPSNRNSRADVSKMAKSVILSSSSLTQIQKTKQRLSEPIFSENGKKAKHL